jgi:hypothetical protein
LPRIAAACLFAEQRQALHRQILTSRPHLTTMSLVPLDRRSDFQNIGGTRSTTRLFAALFPGADHESVT